MTRPAHSTVWEPGRWHHCVGMFLLSLATLVLELALTRVLSVALWYHFGFLVISTALLGFGTSGVVLAGLLVCTGVGAALAGRLHAQPQQHLPLWCHLFLRIPGGNEETTLTGGILGVSPVDRRLPAKRDASLRAA